MAAANNMSHKEWKMWLLYR